MVWLILFLRSGVKWGKDAWPAIESALLRAVVSVWHSAVAFDKKIIAAGLNYRRFLFMSPDLAVTDSGKALVIEVEIYGLWRTLLLRCRPCLTCGGRV